jgi:hypothetical protein
MERALVSHSPSYSNNFLNYETEIAFFYVQSSTIFLMYEII